MSSTLEQLNTYSSGNISYTDNRPEGVRFNYPTAKDITTTVDTQVTQIQRSIDIIEIIKPADANVVFEIDVSAVSGTTVQWSSIPSGINIVNNGVYTIFGIDSVSDWDAMKVGNIVLPVTFFGSFFYTCTIYYTDNGVRKNVSWQVGVFLPEALFASTSSLTCTAQRFRSTPVELLATAGIQQFLYDAQLVNRFSLNVVSINFNFMAATTLSTQVDFDFFQPLSNLSNKTYQSNVSNLIFESDSPTVRDDNPGSSTFEVSFTVSEGVLSTDGGSTTNSSVTISGTQSSVNSALPNLVYYPDYNQTSTVNLTYSIEKDSVLLDSGLVTISHTTEGTLETSVYTFNNSSSFSIPYEEIEYGRWEYLIVGGGGGGAAGGGGGGGQVLKGTNQILSHSSNPYSITVGGAGSRGNYSFSLNSSWSQNAGQGGNSTALGFTAYGGFGGRSSSNNSYTGATVWNFNGGDTRKTDNTSQSAGFGAPIPPQVSGKNVETFAVGAGGGGAGAGQAGDNAVLLGYDDGDTDEPIYGGGDGGDGVTSNITGVSLYYGGGGGGGGGFFGIDSPSNPDEVGRGGQGGGGDGSPNAGALYPAENGVDGLGGGGGGGNNDSVLGPDAWKQPGRGGKGIVILKVTPKV